jgi:hypothetical protein
MDTYQEPLTYEKVWEMFKETDRQFKETDEKIKKRHDLFEGQWSKLIEKLNEGDLVRILKERNVNVNETFTRLKKNYQGSQFEIDIIAANDEEVVAVEVKTSLKIKKVNHFLSKLKIFKEVFPIYKNYRLFGAVGFIKDDEQSAIYAEKRGLFVIKGTGKSSSIVNEQDFIPKVY